jgi:hypothetical protein
MAHCKTTDALGQPAVNDVEVEAKTIARKSAPDSPSANRQPVPRDAGKPLPEIRISPDVIAEMETAGDEIPDVTQAPGLDIDVV